MNYSNVTTVREFLTEYAKNRGGSTEDEALIETLTEEGEIVYTDPDINMHRWYGLQTVVCEIDGVFIEYDKYIITGDAGLGDMDLKYNLDEMSLVEKKERQVTEIYYVITPK